MINENESINEKETFSVPIENKKVKNQKVKKIKQDKEKLSELRNICEFSINDGYKFWTKAERSQSDIDAGVGKATIIDGTGPYKNTKGAKCLYAISFHEEIVFTNIKCNLDDQIFNELKK